MCLLCEMHIINLVGKTDQKFVARSVFKCVSKEAI